ncbi:MAG: hypothetical protein R3E18_11610 [Sphingomonadaceae bacterium]
MLLILHDAGRTVASMVTAKGDSLLRLNPDPARAAWRSQLHHDFTPTADPRPQVQICRMETAARGAQRH